MRLGLCLLIFALLAATPAAVAGPNDVVIVIGNRDYQGNVPRVEFADRDAAAFAKAARDVLGVRPSNIVPLPNLTGTGFRRWFGNEGAGSQLLSELVAARDVRIYVFYSGHGLPAVVGGEALEVLLPIDADPQQAGSEGYAIEWIRKAVRKVLAEKAPEGRAILIFDACFSGSSAAGTLVSNSSAVSLPPSRIRKRAADSVIEIAASSSDQVAYWDTQRKHGAFTDALLDGLYGSAADTTGKVTADSLRRFVQGRVTERLARLYPSERKQQTPTLLGQGDEVLASLAPTRPERDVELAAQERAQCRVLPVSKDEKAIRDFLSSCRECACREGLEQRLGDLARLRATCAAETKLLEGLVGRGESARAELAALQKGAECEAVRVKAGERLALLAPSPVRPNEPAVPSDPALSVRPGSGQSFRERDCPECPEMIVVPAGTFTMGSPANEEGRDNDEGPQRTVTISRPFAVGRFEVTRAEFAAFVSATGHKTEGGCWDWAEGAWKPQPDKSWRNPGFTQTDRDPAVCVSWDDAKAYLAWLSRKTGKPYRLLSEAEWEYAARARSQSRFSFGDSDAQLGAHAWFHSNSGGKTHPVGEKAANAFGLHDMHGNVWEWVEDCWHDSYNGAPSDGSAWAAACTDASRRVLRGGSWYYFPPGLRSAIRYWDSTDYRNYNNGFRVGRTL